MNTLAKLLCVLALAIPWSAGAADDEEHFTEAELDQALAPIALYPDTVLSHVLIASTYPLEVVQAARWSREHSDLRGEEAVDAVEHQDWDASVKALMAFPELLERMSEDLEWTQDLGEAFLAQEGEVMDRVQHLRRRAHEAGHLDSTEHVRVVREREIIYIEPALSHVVYVPYYDTRVVYGGWWWPAYPPYYWSHWGGRPVSYYGHGFYWGLGFRVAPSFYFSSFHWPARQVVVVHHHHRSPRHHFRSGRDVARHENAHRWQHDTRHRRGVAYRSERLSQHHGAAIRTHRPKQAESAARPPERRAQTSEHRRAESRPDGASGAKRRESSAPVERQSEPREQKRAQARPARERSEERASFGKRGAGRESAAPAAREREQEQEQRREPDRRQQAPAASRRGETPRENRGRYRER